jgi:diguanylate cyclase (GGDEF)-like protein/PAS domain S-box-containing protein
MGKNINNEMLTYEQCKEALNVNDIAIWQYNIKENNMVASEKWKNITGYNINEFENLMQFIEKTAIDEDKVSGLNDLNFCMEGKTSFYRSEYRIITKTKAIKWVLFKGKILKDCKGGFKYLAGLVSDITEEKYKETAIADIMYCDSLTGLPNRDSFLIVFKNIIQKTISTHKKGALIFIDLDNFKAINDTLGHHYGDLLLKVFSQLLNICVKDYGKLFRLGGDEFIIIIDKFNSIDNLKELCSNILNDCKKPFELNEKQVYVTTSMGISIFPKDSSDINNLLKFADLAMYQSKSKGKNTYTFFEESISKAYSRKIIIEQELKNSIKNNELFIVYQPQINASENKIIGLEALLRWHNKKLGFVSPVEFIPIAEKTGIILDIGDWVLDKVCKKINEFKQKKYDLKNISVNISPIQIKEPDFKNKIIKVCEKNGIPLNLLEIEITEETLMKIDSKKIVDWNELINKGINISIDDFGTGYSSLNYLTVLPVNTLKIDKSFIDNILNEKNRIVIECILNLSKSLKYKVIAEGVETKEQLDLLMELRCNIIQGYYFSKPVSEDEVELMFKNNQL